MTEALRLAVHWVCETYSVDHLILATHPRNTASQRVAEKVGFRRGETVLRDPPYRDGEPSEIVFEFRNGSSNG